VFVQYPDYNTYYQPQRTMEPSPYVMLQEPQRQEYSQVPRQELIEMPGYMLVQPMYLEVPRY
jgi:hypothetical protein